MMGPPDPVPPRQRKEARQQTPQEAIDEFWAKFTTKAPGKGEFVSALLLSSQSSVGTLTDGIYLLSDDCDTAESIYC